MGVNICADMFAVGDFWDHPAYCYYSCGCLRNLPSPFEFAVKAGMVSVVPWWCLWFHIRVPSHLEVVRSTQNA